MKVGLKETSNYPVFGWVFVCFSAWGLLGCGKPDTPAPKPKDPVVENTQPTEKTNASVDPRLHQSFAEATTQEPPDGQDRPVDKMMNGRVTGKIKDLIVGSDGKGGLWDQIRFVNDSGKKLQYFAVIKTDLGVMKITLLPDISPNHVRNFVALAKAGYYDGLNFDRAFSKDVKIEGEGSMSWKQLEAGSPLGDGNRQQSNVGYWMKPELSTKILHEAGTVGECHTEPVETAATAFYITLSKAPMLDGNYSIFGKLTEGLDVALRILERPARTDDPERPAEPVVIREIKIEVRP